MTVKQIFTSILLGVFSFTAFGQETQGKISIIPEPVELSRTEGFFMLPEVVTIKSAASPEILHTVELLQKRIVAATGAKVNLSNRDDNAHIRLQINADTDAAIGNEGYRLLVNPKQILIKANQPAGLFYGVQSLLQLLPKEIEGDEVMPGVAWRVPGVAIADYPRFGWRGLMFDVSRHFFTKEEVKKYIDNMVKYKYNLLHLHLTDDEGWRIEIKS